MAVNCLNNAFESIYADNAATTVLSKDALEAMIPFYTQYYGNPSSRHELSRKPKQALSECREIISKIINCDPDQVYFTSGGTESDNWAIKGVMLNNAKKKIITSSIEHHAIIEACRSLSSDGYSTIFLPVDSYGLIDKKSLEESLSEDVGLVSIMHANNEIGSVQDLKSISSIIHSHGIVFHSDTVQSVGHIKLDVKEMGLDLISASAHKFNGPKGVGFLFCSDEVDLKPLMLGGQQQNRMRAGTENVPGIVGMTAALSNNILNLSSNQKHLYDLENAFLSTLSDYSLDYRLNSNSSSKLPGLISISFNGISGESLADILSLKHAYVSTGAACDSKNTQISHVLAAIGLDHKYAKGTIRVSFGINNTVNEATSLAKMIAGVVSFLSNTPL